MTWLLFMILSVSDALGSCAPVNRGPNEELHLVEE